MIYSRSTAFNVAFYLMTALLMIMTIPLLLVPSKYCWWVPKTWALTSLWLLKWLAGVDFEIRGLENKPAGGVVLASKHQSAWETFALMAISHRPSYIAKKELTYIPLFGWFLWKLQQITIDRKRGTDALKSMVPQVVKTVGEGRDVIIFPEGTRRPVGAKPVYKYGITAIYKELDAPIVPVALNSGVHWPRRSFLRKPGTIIMEVLPPMPKGLEDKDFKALLRQKIEDATDQLVEESRRKMDSSI